MVNYNNYKKPKSNLLLYSGVALVVMVVIVVVYFFFFTGNDPKAIAVDCVGDWTQDATCPIDCGQSASKVVATYSVTTPMESGGKTCDFTDGATKEVDCPETDECPIDCVGYYDETTVTCPTACGNPASTLTQNYVTTIASSGSGVQCPSSTRSINCAATDECPIDCVGEWGPVCPASCEATTLDQIYNVTVLGNTTGDKCLATHSAARKVTCPAVPSECGPKNLNELKIWSMSGPPTPLNNYCKQHSNLRNGQFCVADCSGMKGQKPWTTVGEKLIQDNQKINWSKNGQTTYFPLSKTDYCNNV